MEPNWKDMTSTPTGALLTVASDITGGGGLIDSVHTTHRMLSVLADVARMLRAGTNLAELRDLGDDAVLALDARAPSAALTDATTDLLRLSGLHTRAHPSTQVWEERRRDAVGHTRDATKKLQSAASMARKFEIVFRHVPQMTVTPVHFSPTWAAWTSLTLRRANDAVVTTDLALNALHRVLDAVLLELKSPGLSTDSRVRAWVGTGGSKSEEPICCVCIDRSLQGIM